MPRCQTEVALPPISLSRSSKGCCLNSLCILLSLPQQGHRQYIMRLIKYTLAYFWIFVKSCQKTPFFVRIRGNYLSSNFPLYLLAPGYGFTRPHTPGKAEGSCPSLPLHPSYPRRVETPPFPPPWLSPLRVLIAAHCLQAPDPTDQGFTCTRST